MKGPSSTISIKQSSKELAKARLEALMQLFRVGVHYINGFVIDRDFIEPERAAEDPEGDKELDEKVLG